MHSVAVLLHHFAHAHMINWSQFKNVRMPADGWGFSQMGSGDGTGPGHNALKNQVVGFLFAAQYMRGESHVTPVPYVHDICLPSFNHSQSHLLLAVPLIFLNAITVFVKLIFG